MLGSAWRAASVPRVGAAIGRDDVLDRIRRQRRKDLQRSAVAGGARGACFAIGVEGALARLSASDRELLLLFGVEGLNHAEVAAVLDIDQVTVRKRVSRARARLAEALDEDAKVMSKSRVGQ